MAIEWYMDIKGKVKGPFSSAELKEHVRSGLVKPDTPIRKGDSQWVRAIGVGGLFDSINSHNLGYVCPYCGSEVPTPPSTCPECNREMSQALEKKVLQDAPPTNDKKKRSFLGRLFRRS